MKPSKTIEAEIRNLHHRHPNEWALFHGHREAVEMLAVQRERVCREIRTHVRPPASHETLRGLVASTLEDHRDLPNAESTYRLAGLLAAVEADPAFPAAVKLFSPLYEKLADARAAEGAELAKLEAERSRLAEQRRRAEEELERRVAEARKPVEGIVGRMRSLGERIAQLTS